MTAYLRSDLWVKSYCIYRAESRATSSRFCARLRARMDFGLGVQLGTVTIAVYAIATALLLIPYVVVALSGRYVDLCGSQRTRQLFIVTTGRLQGACVATGVALVSMVALGFSARARNYFNDRLEQHWLAAQKQRDVSFHQRCHQVVASRMASVVADEIYYPEDLSKSSHLSYYESLVADIASGVRSHTYSLAFGLGGDINGKYERYESSLLKIDGFIRTESRKLWQLPLTYLEVGSWRVREASNLNRQTLRFLDDTAEAEQRARCATYAKKFNHQAYRKHVALFRGEIGRELDGKFRELKEQRQLVSRIWMQRVSALRGRQRFLEIHLAIIQWALTYFSRVMPYSTACSLKIRQVRVQAKLQVVNAQRASGVKLVANGVFFTLNRRFTELATHADGLVQPGGGSSGPLGALLDPR